MRILITGGTGFIGSHLAEKYLELGEEVYLLDNLSTGSLSNIEHLNGNDRLHVVIDDILNHDTLGELIGICDLVFHLAAAVGVKYVIENPLQSIITNVQGTENVLKLCNSFGKKVLIASTSEVYGKHTHSPLVEGDNVIFGAPTIGRWSYAASKLMDEFFALAYRREKGLDVVIVRLFNTVGPRQTGEYGMVIPRFVQQALGNEPITVYGDGRQTRTFTYIKDVVDTFVKLIVTSRAYGQILNLGGAEEISVKDLAEKIKTKTGSKSEIVYVPYDKAYEKDFEDMPRRKPGIKKIEKLVGFKNTFSLDEMLDEIIDYMKGNNKQR
ncbi:MAG: NAD-dependent epimerase/dehydratase family protein [Candidatus Aenigmarchaeota archaeon]|nr:NAD-dependent epimerase/dehydratase family protein [Candidatus Aenigmarchaeota archaeon]